MPVRYLTLLVGCLLGPMVIGQPSSQTNSENTLLLLRRAIVEKDNTKIVQYLAKLPCAEFDEAEVQHLIRKLGSDDFEERERASQQLSEIDPQLSNLLERATEDKDKEIASRALSCLKELYVREKLIDDAVVVLRREAIGSLGELIQFKSATIRRTAIKACKDLEYASGPMIPLLVDSLNDSRMDIRETAFCVLKDLGRTPTPVLLTALSDSRPRVRCGSALLLSFLQQEDRLKKEQSELLFAKLLDFLKDDDFEVQKRAIFVIGKFVLTGNDLALKVITTAITERDPNNPACTCLAKQAARTLQGIGKPASAAIPTLISVINECEDDELRNEAISALGNVGSGNREVVPTLMEMLTKKAISTKCSSLMALRSVGPEAEPAVPLLLPILKSENSEIRRGAILVCKAIRKGAGPATNALADIVRNNRNDERSPAIMERLSAIEALQTIGKSAKDALPTLRQAAKETDPIIAQAATDAIASIEND